MDDILTAIISNLILKCSFKQGKHTQMLTPCLGVMPVMEHQLGEGIDVQKAQETDKQLSPIIVALSNNANHCSSFK